MRSKAVFMALLAFAFAAQGASVSQEEAELAASGWASEGGALGAFIGSRVASSSVHETTNGASFYSVKMYGGGTVFMSSDTEMEPVIAFTDSGRDFSDIDRKSPLWALLSRDASARRAELASRPVIMMPKTASAASRLRAGSSAAAQTTAERWAALVERGESALRISRMLSATGLSRLSEGDLRVPELMESKWDQSASDGQNTRRNPYAPPCYNYYTPRDATGVIEEGDSWNSVCGCVATAMGQVMFYHKYPAAATVPATPDTCWFDTTELTLPVSGEAYDWAAMAAVPDGDTSLESRKAIGLLTSDAGRSVGMAYTDGVDGESGSFTFKASKALVDVFNFGQSVFAEFERRNSSVGSLTDDTTSSKRTLGKVVFSNLDAGYPVIFGIEGKGGHAVVADGYGYKGAKPYVHLNMGWSGEYNLWYNLPDIDTGGGLQFNVVTDAAYNMIPGGAGLGVMSGRVTGEEGESLAGASVSVYDAGTGALVTQLVTSAYGVWGAALPGGTYKIEIEDAAHERTGEIPEVTLAAPVQTGVEMAWSTPLYEQTGNDADAETGIMPVVASAKDLGNSWGNDVALLYPRVRIVSGGVENIYTSLDKAFAAARVFAEGGETPVLEILRPVNLNDDVEIGFDCELRAATGEDSSTVVNRPDGAAITILDGGSLVVSNCDFEVTGEVPLVAEAGGRIFVGPGLSAERVSTHDVAGFNVIGFVDSDLAVECTVARAEGAVFGYATTDDDEALGNSVARIYATFSEDSSVRAELGEKSDGSYQLVWTGGADVPLVSSAGYYVTADGKTNTFARVDRLFESFENALAAGKLGSSPEIVIVGHDAVGLSRDVVVDGISLVIRGESDAELTPLDASHIVVTNGGSLVVRDLVVGDREGDTFVRVYDGTMTLGDGAVFSNIACTGNFDYAGASSAPPALHAGPVAVMAGGTFRLDPGASIVGCRASGTGYGGDYGGGVYVASGGTIELAGGSIENCQASSGGGVYAESGANVIVSGPSVVSGNTDGKGSSDIYFANAVSRITVAKTAAGGSMGVRYGPGTGGNAEGFVFAAAGAKASAHDIEDSASAFFNDANSEKKASAAGTSIKWAVGEDASGDPQPVGDSSVAVAKVDYPKGYTKFGATAYWASAQDAFWSLEGVTASGSATVTLLQDDWFDADIVVNCTNCAVTLASDTTEPATLQRSGDVSIIVDGASLTVGNVALSDALVYYFGSDIYAAEQPLFSVAGGELVLDGAVIADVVSSGRFGAAITATEGATVTLRNGAEISDCENVYEYTADNTSYAGAILADGEGTKLVLEDCAITGCSAYRTGGVCIDNGATVEISGSATVSGNETSEGDDANLTVAASSSLILAGKLTGDIGVRRDIAADRTVFGSVASSFSGSDADLVSSAMKFTNDGTGDHGVAVRSADKKKTLLVWLSMLPDGDVYTDSDGVEYTLVTAAGVSLTIEPPVAEVGLVYNGEEQVGVAAGRGYTLTGVAAATAPGTYSAVAKLASGYVWSDGSTAAKTITWTISKAEVDVSGVKFEDATYFYDGTPKSLAVSGELPPGVTVFYSGNEWTQPGAYTVTASFTVDDDGYEAPDDMTATLTIVRSVEVPTARQDLVYTAADQAGVPAGDGYLLSGDVTGIDAGTNYTTVASLEDYNVWSDGTTNDLELVWSIGPAPLTVTAHDAWKLVSSNDTTAVDGATGAGFGFALENVTVTGLQGGDTADGVLTGRLVRTEGEALGSYLIMQGTLQVVETNPNYEIASFEMGVFKILLEPPAPSRLPPLEDTASAADVAAALAGSDIADDAVAEAINNAEDPLAAYNEFRNWALAVEGGVDAACDGGHAYVSYKFGVTEVFENVPTVTFTSITVEDPSEAAMKVSLVVKDGDAEKAVDASKVAALFEVSADLATWTGELTATANEDGTYTVKPADSTLKAAFIRLSY